MPGSRSGEGQSQASESHTQLWISILMRTFHSQNVLIQFINTTHTPKSKLKPKTGNLIETVRLVKSGKIKNKTFFYTYLNREGKNAA